jgi:mono/diheme cytochrome c family protein
MLIAAGALSSCSSPDRRLPPAYRDVAVPEVRLASVEGQRHGRELFLAHCALCHGERADGHGVRTDLSSPAADLTDRHWRARVTPRYVYYRLCEGVRGTPMPSWRSLPDEELWDLVAYALSVSKARP